MKGRERERVREREGGRDRKREGEACFVWDEQNVMHSTFH